MSICEDCICRKYCGDDDIRRCDRYFRDGGIKKEPTNEEWIKQCNTEQLAEWIAHQTMIALLENQNNHSLRMTYPAYWVEWLKQPHTDKE